MKKLLSTIMLLTVSVCSGCTFNHIADDNTVNWDNIADTLKTQSPECRKVGLVGVPFAHAYEDMKNKDYNQALVDLCVSYTYYQIDYVDINTMVESSDGTYLSKRMSDIISNCVNIIYDEGDKSWVFASMADDELKPYIEKHFDECFK